MSDVGGARLPEEKKENGEIGWLGGLRFWLTGEYLYNDNYSCS